MKSPKLTPPTYETMVVVGTTLGGLLTYLFILPEIKATIEARAWITGTGALVGGCVMVGCLALAKRREINSKDK